MKIGLIARMDETGLGYQTKDWFLNMRPDRTLVIDSTPFKTDKQGRMLNLRQHPEWYAGTQSLVRYHKGFLDDESMEWLLAGIDILVSCEIFYGYQIVDVAKKYRVKTVLQYNHEFLDYFEQPSMTFPTLFLAPSSWMLPEMEEFALGRSRTAYLPLPIDRTNFPFTLKHEAKRFLHIAGFPTYEDRNGTEIVFEAMKHVKSYIDLTVVTQHTLENVPNDSRIHIVDNIVDNHKMYDNQEVLLIPRKYGGLCLPLNEALSCGMLALMPQTNPQRKFLPGIELSDVSHMSTMTTRTTVPMANTDPIALAKRIDEIASFSRYEVEELSQISDAIAEIRSWENLRTRYLELFESL